MRACSAKMLLLTTTTTLVTAMILGLLAAIMMSLHLAEVAISPDGSANRHISFALAWGLIATFMVADILCIRSLLRLRRTDRGARR